MKSKKLEKKLVFKRVTIVRLSEEELLKVNGKGTVWTRLCEAHCDDQETGG